MKNFLKILKIDEYSLTPYYRQLCNCILQGINEKLIDENDILPSINDLSIALDISRNIVTKSYNTLKKSGIISSVHGKGYYVSNVNLDRPVKVLLLFNKLSSHKKLMYDAFAEALGNQASIDFYIYNNSFNFFKKILLEKQDSYDKVVVVPHFIDKIDNAHEVINQIPKDKLILLGKLVEGVEGDFGAVYEDFENDIFNALEELLPQIKRYHSCTIVFPKNSYFPVDILIGFLSFCKQYNCEYDILSDMSNQKIRKDTLYITLTEDDLVAVINLLLQQNLKLKEDVGLISYNETPLKKFILNGITTISTDFEFMGKHAAQLVLNSTHTHIKVPFNTIIRESI
ncbi:DNA-binding transcriptional regulator YhcF (GntR family) [Mucilaginibacter sp. UYNi724]